MLRLSTFQRFWPFTDNCFDTAYRTTSQRLFHASTLTIFKDVSDKSFSVSY